MNKSNMISFSVYLNKTNLIKFNCLKKTTDYAFSANNLLMYKSYIVYRLHSVDYVLYAEADILFRTEFCQLF